MHKFFMALTVIVFTLTKSQAVGSTQIPNAESWCKAIVTGLGFSDFEIEDSDTALLWRTADVLANFSMESLLTGSSIQKRFKIMVPYRLLLNGKMTGVFQVYSDKENSSADPTSKPEFYLPHAVMIDANRLAARGTGGTYLWTLGSNAKPSIHRSQEDPITPIETLKLGSRIQALLKRYKISSVEELTSQTSEALQSHPEIGPITIVRIQNALGQIGLNLAAPDQIYFVNLIKKPITDEITVESLDNLSVGSRRFLLTNNILSLKALIEDFEKKDGVLNTKLEPRFKNRIVWALALRGYLIRAN